MKKLQNLSKVALSFFVIFQLAFATTITPVVALAFEGDVPVSQEPTKGDVDKGDGPVRPNGGEEPTKPDGEDPTKPESEDPTKPENPESSPTIISSGSSGSVAGEVKGIAKIDKPETCTASGNLLTNGGFETPVVSGDWDIYTSIPGWTVEWMPGSGNDEPANIEIQNSGLWTPYEGEQYVELDSDFDGPSGSITGEAGSTKISQTIETAPGTTYTIKFAFSPRPGTPLSDNNVGLYIDDFAWDLSTSSDGSANSDTAWFTREYNFTATGSTTKISLADLGTANSLGTFIDDVSVVSCDDEPEECPAEQIYARVKFSKISNGGMINGWRNWGNGDVAPQIFVGGDTPAHQYDDEEWFPLTNPDGTFINDPDLNTYRNVKGLAVQRTEGSVRVVLYGFHLKPKDTLNAIDGPLPPGQTSEEDVETTWDGSKELAAGVVEISANANFEAGIKSPVNWGPGDVMDGWSNSNSNPRTHDPYVNDASNRMDKRGDYGGYINQYHYRFDRMKTKIPTKTQFHLVATTGSDGFYARYQHENSGEDCDGEENFPPEITVFPTEVNVTVGGFYDIMTGVTGDDFEDGPVTTTENIEPTGTVDFNTIGDYTIYYDVTDSDGNPAVQKSRIIHVVPDGDGGGDPGDPDLAVPGLLCLEDSVVEYDFTFGATATDAEDGDLTAFITNDSDVTVIYGTIGDYVVTYSVTDSDLNTNTTTRDVHIRENCDDDNGGGGGGNGGGGGGGGNGGGGGGGSGSGGGSGGGSLPQGEVLGAEIGPACTRFTEYYDTGDIGGEIEALQIFLNEYMDAGLVVDGVYGRTTTQAIHNLQAMYWDEIIDPWTPPLSPNTTGRFYKTTRATVNALIGCPEGQVYLEDPKTMFEISVVDGAKEFDSATVVNSIDTTHGTTN